MDFELNALNQPVGRLIPGWKAPPQPPRSVMQGRLCRLEPLDPARHAHSLYVANMLDVDGRTWTYLPYGPFESEHAYRTWIETECGGNDPLFYAIIDHASGNATGVASYMRIMPNFGSIEVGHIHYSPLLQRSPAATEAMVLMMARAFELGYRRYEWKCNALNAASRAAAQRLGFSFEGIFRQTNVIKGRNRDTAWYAVIDQDWPALKQAFETWLSPSNFDETGKQRTRLSELTAPLLVQRG